MPLHYVIASHYFISQHAAVLQIMHTFLYQYNKYTMYITNCIIYAERLRAGGERKLQWWYLLGCKITKYSGDSG